MKLGGYWPHRMDRVAAVAGGALVIFMLLLSVASVGTYAMVHHTARSEFCNSCHIMEPYYSSWQKSSHHDVPCIDCHYEPGSLETIEGKFKALSQLAKYVTRTAGTKPWAEVSDQSCMRSGCHSLRMLEGEVQFGRVKFNHRQHLLESRRGRRLRCTSCHSQIVQGQHIAVTPSVCFTCHFMPGSDGRRPPETSDCLICHGPPKQAIELAGKSFVHQDYVERGVRCTECHNPVISGNGSVGRDRCHSCHGEVGHIERIGETAFMHEKHVTEHKVECFECHDEIRHGLLPLPSSAVARDQGCGTCHVDPHDAARQVYAGRGAIGVAESPSRMFVARVVCDACHTGRAGFAATPHAAHVEGDVAASHQGVSRVARAAEADCIHCHGPRFAGMLGEWRQGIGQQIDRLRPLLGSLGKQVAAASSGAAQKLYQEAWHDFELVDLDGSRGVHNPAYALATLRACAERVDAASALLDGHATTAATAGIAAPAGEGCSSCHVAPELRAVAVNGKPFSHPVHVTRAALACGACHRSAPLGQPEHGQPTFERSKCGSCHHQEGNEHVADCAACHREQEAMLRGTIAGLAEAKPGPMGKMECTECHGEPPKIVRPRPQACVVCHEAGYDQMRGDWQQATSRSIERVTALLADAEQRHVASDACARARAVLAALAADGSRGVHNHELAKFLLEDVERALSSP